MTEDSMGVITDVQGVDLLNKMTQLLIETRQPAQIQEFSSDTIGQHSYCNLVLDNIALLNVAPNQGFVQKLGQS